MSDIDKVLKRIFDIIFSSLGLILLGWLILLSALLATIDTGLNGFFNQARVGQNGKLFHVLKIRSMRNIKGITTTVSINTDPRITKIGRFWRKTKIDELPQLINVFIGQMSFVGPRPDVSGFADKLIGNDKIILSIKPGITGPASIYFKDEEKILVNKENPEKYNIEVIWPKKVELNKKYILEYSIIKDVGYILKTIL